MKKKRGPWPLDRLVAEDRNAITVYVTLRWLVGSSRQLNTTRETIRSWCGLSLKLISSSMTALDKTGWVSVNYAREGVRTWFRLTFPKSADAFFPLLPETMLGRKKGNFPVGRKTTHRGATRGSKNDPQGTSRCGSKNDLPSSKRGTATATALPPPIGVGSASASVPCPQPNRVARKEREMMAEIRAKREAEGDA